MFFKQMMRLFLFLFLILGINSNPVNAQNLTSPVAAPSASPPPLVVQDYNQVPEAEKLVDIRSVNLNIRLDIRYATTNNFLNKKIYAVPRCLLRYDVAQRLSRVQQDLEQMGLGLKVYDCYRPLSVTRQMWEILPDSRYVANPARGSRHNRGAAVDLTLVDLRTGAELEMPTDFDDFTDKAARDYPGNSPQVRRNSDLLAVKMKQQGFISLITEWWHFDAPGWDQYGLLDIPLENIR
ncbi:putative peptidase [Planktothrix serta PCC 8927]|uniref:D-alanyl-D-alanine dipeptidase n=1 Tax=Planktothrix serta PCC 8927 TaxID=671068 RepID=A0A7Z9E3A7_9CYAN|nr:M15 family metallopeptidase [Planktothrix serta]VXD21124.1 putative peptidase [Planktothrix serta PCC 8927]